MNDLRQAAQQVLSAWQTSLYGKPSHQKAVVLAMTNLNIALEQPAVKESLTPEQQPKSSAERTLCQLGYTDCGGEFWKPPLGEVTVMTPTVTHLPADDTEGGAL